MRTIHCTRCGLDLPVEAFRAAQLRETSKKARCKKCQSAYARAWNLAHPDRVKKTAATHRPKAQARMSKWNRENRDHLTGYMRQWREANRQVVRDINAKSRARHPDRVAASKVERQARMRTHVPPWADRAAMKAIYLECRRLSKETGIKHHVDHIIPLKGKNVSGLHVETNLQILSGAENMRKANRVMEALL